MKDNSNSLQHKSPLMVDKPLTKNITLIIYILQALACFVAILPFLLNLSALPFSMLHASVVIFIIALFASCFNCAAVCGTWLESHSRWQIRTFCYGFLWVVASGFIAIFGVIRLILAYFGSAPVEVAGGNAMNIIGIGMIIFFVNLAWVMSRIIYGLFILSRRRELHAVPLRQIFIGNFSK